MQIPELHWHPGHMRIAFIKQQIAGCERTWTHGILHTANATLTDCLYGLVSRAFVLGPLEQLIYSWQQFKGRAKKLRANPKMEIIQQFCPPIHDRNHDKNPCKRSRCPPFRPFRNLKPNRSMNRNRNRNLCNKY